ncbi:MAG: Ig-like domain-containing protein, partial [Actinomycetota bacterium]|nr:Ig-like domain-containing protein [Actinomycetota bacterium]
PDTARTFTLRCEDEDGPRRAEAQVLDGADHGRLDHLGGLRFRYDAPAAGATQDSFTFRVSDGAGQTGVLTQELLITGENVAPRCLPRDLTAAEGVPLEGACYDPNPGDAAKPVLVDAPQHGAVRLGDNPWYTPSSGYQGPDSFSLKASDGRLTGAPATIEVEAVAVGPPLCDPLPTVPVRPGQTKTIRPVCRDNRLHPASDLVEHVVVDEPDHGQVDAPARWPLQYTPDEGYEGPDQLTVVPTTPYGEGPPVTVDLAVSETANEPPACQPIDALRVRSGATAELGAFCGDPDHDQLELIHDPGPSHGAIGTGDGARTYTADEGFSGSDDFAARWSDGTATTAPIAHRVQVVADGENTLPDCPARHSRVRRNMSASFSLRCDDAERDRVSFTWEQPEHGTVTEVPGGFPYAGRALLYTPQSGYTGPDRLRVRAEDAHGGVTWVTHVIDVFAPEAPVCHARSRALVRPGEQLWLRIYCIADEMPVYPEVIAGPSHGTIEYWGLDQFVYKHADGHTGLDSITLKAETAGGTDEVVQEIEVTPEANWLPTCLRPSRATTRAAAVELELPCGDGDGDPLTLTVVDGPAHGELGAWDQATKRVVYTPDGGFVGTDEFTFRVSDGRGESATFKQRVLVRAPDANYAPRCAGGGAVTDPGEPVTFAVTSCYDSDGDPITLSLAEQPKHGTATGPDGDGMFTYTPDAGFQGTDTIGLRASDGKESSPVQSFSVTVGPYDFTTPRCRPIAANVRHGTPRRVQLRCAAPFDQPVAPVIVDGPDHGTL